VPGGLRSTAGTSTAAITTDTAAQTAPTVNAWLNAWPASPAATRPPPVFGKGDFRDDFQR
jgi:hypothetical protein